MCIQSLREVLNSTLQACSTEQALEILTGWRNEIDVKIQHLQVERMQCDPAARRDPEGDEITWIARNAGC